MIETMIGLAAGAALALSQAQARIEDLGWMSGRWESVAGERWTEETWSAPRGGVMLGFSRGGEGPTMREFEFIRLAAGEDGVLTYFASPGGGPAVAFRLVRADRSSASFANPAHDFPQLISYRREGGRMTATISALDGSGAISWSYRRRR